MQTHRIIKGPHELFVGANGHKTYGIEVRAIDENRAREKGHRVEYSINDYSIAAYNLSFLGLSRSEEIELKTRVATLAKEQK